MAEESSNINDILEGEISEMIKTRFNLVTGVVEYSKAKSNNFRPMTDYMERSIVRSLKSKGHKVTLGTVRNILNSDFSAPYNPFVDYFGSLPKWDGKINYIEQYCNLVDVENDEYWVKWTTKWLVSLVVGSINPEVVNQQVLVLSGGQGIGKTTWLNNLVPKALEKYASTGYVNPDSKDALIQASECLLMNMDELSSLSPKSIEAFKQLVTQTKIRLRKPYGFNPENLIKRASFCGSTNEDQFLVDATGNRRFLCFKAKDIDLDAVAKFNIDNLFSQAHTLYKDGMQYWFNKAENKLIEANNLDYITRSVEEEAIMSRFQICDKDDNSPLALRWTATDVMISLSGMGLVNNSQATAQRVGIALTRLGYVKYKSSGRMFYKLKMR